MLKMRDESNAAECEDCSRLWFAKTLDANGWTWVTRDGYPLVSNISSLILDQRCPVPSCDSNHQLACNIAAKSTVRSICRCEGVKPGTMRAAKPLSETVLTDAERGQMKAASVLLEAIVGQVGKCSDFEAIARIKMLIATYEQSVHVESPQATFASAEQIAAVTVDNPIAKAMVDAYYEQTETDEITHAGLAFALDVSKMIGINFTDDPEAVISDLRWIGRMAESAADQLTEEHCG